MPYDSGMITGAVNGPVKVGNLPGFREAGQDSNRGALTIPDRSNVDKTHRREWWRAARSKASERRLGDGRRRARRGQLGGFSGRRRVPERGERRRPEKSTPLVPSHPFRVENLERRATEETSITAFYKAKTADSCGLVEGIFKILLRTTRCTLVIILQSPPVGYV